MARNPRSHWNSTRRSAYALTMYKTTQVGDKVRVVWLDGGYGGIEPGMIATVIRRSSAEIRVTIPGTKYTRDDEDLATLYWYEVESMVACSPIERKLREFSAG